MRRARAAARSRRAGGHARAKNRRAHSRRRGAWARLPSTPTSTRSTAIDDYARELGLAFQIIDDVLDVEGSAEELGKTAGKDAAAGKPTYPVALWRRRVAAAGRRVRRAREGDPGRRPASRDVSEKLRNGASRGGTDDHAQVAPRPAARRPRPRAVARAGACADSRRRRHRRRPSRDQGGNAGR